MTTPSTADIPGAVAPGRDALLEPSWSYMQHTSMEHFRTEDWNILNRQREQYRTSTLASRALRLLAAQQHDASFGYQVNNYHHSLQTAVLVHRDGLDEEDIVLGLLHDVGFTLAPQYHEAFADAIIGPYLSEKNRWILLNHPLFQAHHIHGMAGVDPRAREVFRGHPWFEDCANWVRRYDIVAIDPDIAVPPLEFFEPMVQRFFARPPNPA